MDNENIAIIVGAAVTGLSLVNEKVRNFVTGKATFKKETTEATDDTIERLMNRVNALSDEFTRLSELNILTHKTNYELQNKVNQLENEISKTKSIIANNCKNNCFE